MGGEWEWGERGAETTPGEGVWDGDREINREEQNWRRAGGGGRKDCESAVSALHQKLCQSLTTSDQNPPPPPLSSTHTLIPLLLTVSQGCPRLNVNPPLSVAEHRARQGTGSMEGPDPSEARSVWRSHPR